MTLKEYFDKKFNELKNSLDVNNNTHENFQGGIKLYLQKLANKLDNTIKALESDKKLLPQQITALPLQNKKTQPNWNSRIVDPVLGLIVFLKRTTKKTSLNL